MGYEIMYNTFTVRKNGKYIPMVVTGSNNCFEVNYKNGRKTERRERNLNKAYPFFNGKQEFKRLEEMDKHFDSEGIQEEMNGGMIQGRFKTAKGLLKSFKKYITVEVPTRPQLKSLYYSDISDESKERIKDRFRKKLENKKKVLTKEEEKETINKCINDLKERDRKELLSYVEKLGNKRRLIYYDCYRRTESRKFIKEPEKEKGQVVLGEKK